MTVSDHSQYAHIKTRVIFVRLIQAFRYLQEVLAEFTCALGVTGAPGWAFFATTAEQCPALTPRPWNAGPPTAGCRGSCQDGVVIRCRPSITSCCGRSGRSWRPLVRRELVLVLALRSCCSKEYIRVLTCRATAAVSCAALGRWPPSRRCVSW